MAFPLRSILRLYDALCPTVDAEFPGVDDEGDPIMVSRPVARVPFLVGIPDTGVPIDEVDEQGDPLIPIPPSDIARVVEGLRGMLEDVAPAYSIAADGTLAVPETDAEDPRPRKERLILAGIAAYYKGEWDPSGFSIVKDL